MLVDGGVLFGPVRVDGKCVASLALGSHLRRCLLLRLTSCVIFAMKTATNSQDYERHTVSTRLTLYYDGHAVAVSHYACRAQTSQGKVPGLCPIPQVFEKEDEPNRNRTWIRLLRHETGRPLHV